MELVMDLGTIKDRVTAMLEERAGFPASAFPSSLWAEGCEAFAYMLELPDKAFAKLRLHTYHFTGDNYQYYVFGEGEARLWETWRSLTKGVPQTHVLAEPVGAVEGIGFSTPDGQRVSQDILRFQEAITTLWTESVLTKLPSRPTVLEIGGGYGGLAHHLSRLATPGEYVIVDLPEALLFSAAYLSLLNPDKRVTVYDPNKPGDRLDGDFILVPNYRLSLLERRRFDLALNVASMQEMRTDQVEQYLTFISRTLRGVFYCHNLDRLPQNAELTGLVRLLPEYFEVSEIQRRTIPRRRVKAMLKRIAARLGLADPPVSRPPYRTFLCRPQQPERIERKLGIARPS